MAEFTVGLGGRSSLWLTLPPRLGRRLRARLKLRLTILPIAVLAAGHLPGRLAGGPLGRLVSEEGARAPIQLPSSLAANSISATGSVRSARSARSARALRLARAGGLVLRSRRGLLTEFGGQCGSSAPWSLGSLAACGAGIRWQRSGSISSPMHKRAVPGSRTARPGQGTAARGGPGRTGRN